MEKEIKDFLDTVHNGKTYATYKAALKTFVDVVGEGAPLTKETYIKFLRVTKDMNASTQALCRSAIKGLYLSAADSDSNVLTAFFQQTDKRLALKPGKRLILFNNDS